MRRGRIYAAGVIPLGLLYYWLEERLPRALFLVVFVVYLIVLRLLAERYGKDIEVRHEDAKR